jgi:hypothetical protein
MESNNNELPIEPKQETGHKNSADAANRYLGSLSEQGNRERVLAFLIENPGSTGRDVDYHLQPDNPGGTFSYSSILSSLRESGKVAGEKGVFRLRFSSLQIVGKKESRTDGLADSIR